jgi:hypothetical protein
MSSFRRLVKGLLLSLCYVGVCSDCSIFPIAVEPSFSPLQVLIVRVDHNGRIESFTSFRSESGPVDEQGEWAGDELIFTLQVRGVVCMISVVVVCLYAGPFAVCSQCGEICAAAG